MSRHARAVPSQQLALFDAPATSVAYDEQPGVPTAIAPVAPVDTSARGPAVFRHPQADREIRLHEHVIGYSLRRARRRSIGFIVGGEGLSVNAPRWVGLSDIESALREKSAWILRKLQEQQDRARRLQAAKVEWRDGASIPFLGQAVVLRIDPRATGAVLEPRSNPPGGAAPMQLMVGLSHASTPEQIREVVQAWLQQQARQLFEERCAVYAARLGVRVKRMSLSSAQTRWGSASADGSIRLNWRLIHFGLHSVDYVVVHELAHLREMNHSPKFWGVVRSVLPDFEVARSSLKDGLVPLLD
jgi:predicted metal-dependent hydrolase